MPKSKRPPDLGMERGTGRQEQPGDQDKRAEQRSDSVTSQKILKILGMEFSAGAVAGLVGIECGVVSGVINLESSGVEASDWRPRHDKQYHAA